MVQVTVIALKYLTSITICLPVIGKRKLMVLVFIIKLYLFLIKNRLAEYTIKKIVSVFIETNLYCLFINVTTNSNKQLIK